MAKVKTMQNSMKKPSGVGFRVAEGRGSLMKAPNGFAQWPTTPRIGSHGR